MWLRHLNVYLPSHRESFAWFKELCSVTDVLRGHWCQNYLLFMSHSSCFAITRQSTWPRYVKNLQTLKFILFKLYLYSSRWKIKQALNIVLDIFCNFLPYFIAISCQFYLTSLAIMVTTCSTIIFLISVDFPYICFLSVI